MTAPLSSQYVMTLITRTPSGKIKKQNIQRPFDRAQITDMREEDDGRIIIELIREVGEPNGGISIEHCYLDSPGQVAYITLGGKTVQTIKFEDQSSESTNGKKDQRLRV